MFRKIKRKKVTFDNVYEMLTEECEYYYGLYLDYLKLAKIQTDQKMKDEYLSRANSYMNMSKTVCQTKERFYQKFGRG